MPSTVITLPEAPNGLQKKDGTSDFDNLSLAIVAGGNNLQSSVITRQDLVITKLTLTSSNETDSDIIKNNDNNFYSDDGSLKQYIASYVQHKGLRNYENQYDAMSAFGYTQDAKDKGLWTDGVDKFTFVVLVPRLNKGAYHPSYNPYGCSKWKAGGAGTGGIDSWWDWYRLVELGFSATSISDAFNPALTYVDNGGFISGTTGSGRPADDPYLYYDAIYAGQVKDLRTSAKYKSPSELLSDYYHKAVSGSIRGFGAVPFTRVYNQTLPTIGGTGDEAIALQIGNTEGVNVGDVVDWQNSNGDYQRGYVDTITSQEILVKLRYPNNTRHRLINTPVVVACTGKYQFKSAIVPWQDIIGDPINILSVFPDGVIGMWIPNLEAENTYKHLNRKAEGSAVSRVATQDNGANFGFDLPSLDTNVNAIVGETGPWVSLISYETNANPYVSASNYDTIGETGDVFVTCAARESDGNSLILGLLNKVGTGAVSNSFENTHAGRIFNHSFITGTRKLSSLSTSRPTHRSIDTVNLDSSSVAVKAFPYITQENQQYFLQWVYKELIWDTTLDGGDEFVDVSGADASSKTVGTYYHVTSGNNVGYWYCLITTTAVFNNSTLSEVNGYLINSDGYKVFKRWDGNGFGDDNTFNIVDGTSTITDDNGNQVIVGQKRVALPYFTGEN